MERSFATKILRKLFSNYFGIPRLAWFIFPLIVLDNLIVSIILNLPLFLEKIHGIHEFETGKIISLYYVGNLIGAFLGGSLSLRFSSIKLSSISMVFYGAIFYYLSVISNPSQFEVVAVCIGFFGAIVSTSNLSSFVRTSGSKSSITLINLELIIFNVCISVGSYILLTFSLNELISFFKFIALSVCCGGLYVLLLRNNTTFSPPCKTVSSKIFYPKNIRLAIFLFISVFLVGLIFSMIKVIYAPTVESRFGGNGEAAFIASLNPWILLLIQPHLVAWFKGRYDKNFIIMGVGGFLVGLGYFLFGVSSGFMYSAMSITLLTFGEVLFAPISKNIALSSFERGRDGFVLGLWRAVFLGSGFIGPVISGWLSQNYGNMVVWELCAILGIICFFVAMALKFSKNDDLPSASKRSEEINI